MVKGRVIRCFERASVNHSWIQIQTKCSRVKAVLNLNAQPNQIIPLNLKRQPRPLSSLWVQEQILDCSKRPLLGEVRKPSMYQRYCHHPHWSCWLGFGWSDLAVELLGLSGEHSEEPWVCVFLLQKEGLAHRRKTPNGNPIQLHWISLRHHLYLPRRDGGMWALAWIYARWQSHYREDLPIITG